ncbi:hypothetical protein ACFL1X_01430 [Candidatus Hydrogenedentota bacterium]
MTSQPKSIPVILIGFFIVVVIAILGCRQTSLPDNIVSPNIPSIDDIHAETQQWMVTNPCGSLRVKRPLFNITGDLTAQVKPNSTIYFFIAPNTTLVAALRIVGDCSPIAAVQVSDVGRFRLFFLPASDYIGMIPETSFISSQGFPVIEEFNHSNHSVRMVWYGGNQQFSLAAFSIRSNLTENQVR